MAEPLENDAKRRFDPIVTIGACFFVLAVVLAAMPAFKAGPSTIAGLLLLAGLAGVAFLGLIAFRGASRTASVIGDTDFAAFAASLTEPAAICAADGMILSANGSWREGGGRSEEHTSELQSLTNLVCLLLLENKNKIGDHFAR